MNAARAFFQLAVGMTALAARPVLRVLREGGDLVGAHPDAVWAHRLVGLLVSVWDDPLGRWERVGRDEVRKGETLAHIAVDHVRSAIFDELARSSQLKDLVREQSQGLTHSAIEEVRSVGAQADDRAEHLVRRLFRRTR
jgi:hypothetical protein